MTKIVNDSKVIHKRQNHSDNSFRKLWTLTEIILARIEVLEHFDQDYSHKDRSRCVLLASASSLVNEEVDRLLYKLLKIALTRVSILENKRDISYRSAFKASNEIECIIRECENYLSKKNHALRHLKTIIIFEHQIAAIVLNQTQCLKCDKSWKISFDLVHHETTVHEEIYTSRMNVFRSLFEQTVCMRLALMITQNCSLINCRLRE